MIRAQLIEVCDEDLAYRAKEGEDNALKELGRRYQVIIYKICKFQMEYYNNHVNREDINDISNTVLLKMLTKISTYDREKGKLKTWVKGIARNSVIDFLRKSNPAIKRDLDEKFWDRLIETKNDDELLKDINLYYSENEILDIIIKKLSNREKEVIQLIMNGCNHSEVSTFLGIKYNYAKVIYCRIIKKAQKIYLNLLERIRK